MNQRHLICKLDHNLLPASDDTGWNRRTSRVNRPTTSTGRNISVLEFGRFWQPVLYVDDISLNAIMRVCEGHVAVIERFCREKDRAGRVIGDQARRDRRRVNSDPINGANRQSRFCIAIGAYIA